MEPAPWTARATILMLVFAVFGVAGLAAFTMEPMVATVTPSGAPSGAPSGEGSIATFHFRNEGSEPIAIRMKVLTRALRPDGTEENNPADASFEIYPERLALEPGASAVVKLRYTGSDKIDRELPFRFVAEQVPVDFGASGGSGIKVLFRYVASLYVGLPSFKPSIAVSARPDKGPGGKAGFSIEIRNEGTRHAVVTGLSVELALADGSLLALSEADLKALSDLNYLPGTSRRVFVPDGRASQGGSCDVRSHFELED